MHEWLKDVVSNRPIPLIAAPIRVLALVVAVPLLIAAALLKAAVAFWDALREYGRLVMRDIIAGHLPD